MKKTFSVLLSVTLAGAALAACSTDKENENAAGPSETGQPAKISVALGTGNLPYVTGSRDINSDKYVKKLEELAKVDLDLELIPHENYSQSLTLMFASGEMPNLLQTKGINTPEVAPAVDSGNLMPLNDLIDQYGPNLKKYVPKESWDSTRVSKDGKIYGIPQENPIRNGTVTYIRQDWLDKLGLKTPKTIDEYIEVLRAFRDQDPNGNGKKDEIPFTSRAKFSFGQAFFGAYDVAPALWKQVDGQLVPNFIRPEMKDALKLYKQLYEEKLIDNEFFVMQGKDWDAKIKGTGVAGMWAHSASYPDKWENDVKAAVPTAKVSAIPSPVGPSGKPGGSDEIGSTVSDYVWVIPKDTKNAADVIKFLDWYYNPDNKDKDNFLLYGLDGETYTVDNGQIKYKAPTTPEETQAEFMHQGWLAFTGQKKYLTDETFIKSKPGGDKILATMKIAAAEGLVNDGSEMPVMPAMQARPELKYDGLWLEFASKVVTGKEPVEKFDEFVADWKKRGGEQLVKEATEWYKAKQK
jgi:putative aldouronate transport system substrate-binding protein